MRNHSSNKDNVIVLAIIIATAIIGGLMLYIANSKVPEPFQNLKSVDCETSKLVSGESETFCKLEYNK